MKHSEYVPLHLHTEYSLLDGAIKIKELVKRAAEFKMPAVAITDHGNLFGAIEFYRAAVKEGLKPIIGCEVYVAPKGRQVKDKNSKSENAFHLILLARDMNGYKNLVSLVSRAYLEGFYYKPRIDHDLLEQYSGGLIGLSSCMHGEVPYYLLQGDIDRARKAALQYKHILGAENFYLELQDNGLKDQRKANRMLLELSKELHIPVVATNDCHYLNRADARAHEILLCIQTGKTLNHTDRMRFETDQLYFKSPDEMKRAFSEVPEAIKNTIEIAERCNLEFKLGNYMLPRYSIETGQSPEEYLRELVLEGLKKKVGENPPEDYKKRIEYELSVIFKMGFASYFLIVWDFINFARKRGIPVGPGRGSAAGSLVAYCLDITDIDPIRYNLLFERFLNPERISMPDIDVDFCKDRRGEVIQYVEEKYGKDHVAQIITFGTMAARAVIRDVGRVLSIPYSRVDEIAKMVPAGPNITIQKALELEPELKKQYESDQTVRELIDIAQRLEGLSRHASTHAAGVVISPTPLTDYAPLYKNPSEDTVTTQFDMKSVEAIGLLKFDFLGLKTLTVIDRTLRYIGESGKSLDINKIPMDDEKTYRLLSEGRTTGVFQLESSGMREILIKMQPNRFEDLIALVALYRPGPLGSGMVDNFIKGKKGEIEVKYEIPELKDILDETYGVILYQEQVMRIANKLAGFSMGQADVLRKAMGKKLKDKMAEMGEEFVKGAVKRGIKEEKARKLFELMSFFGEYGFNKSHSAAYAYLSYQTAYLKAHYPVEFLAANLSEEDKTEKIVLFINECKSMGIEVLPPDVNLSGSNFKVVGGAIRFGLDAVKGVGPSAVEEILRAREDGPFKSIEDFLRRIDSSRVNRKVLESLVKAGAFDSLVEGNSTELKRAIAMDQIESQLGRKDPGPSLFGDMEGSDAAEPSGTIKPWEVDELLRYEKEALGFYITGHPLSKYSRYLKLTGVVSTSKIEDLRDGANIRIAGIITELKKKTTKEKGSQMAIFVLEDEEGFIECIAFPDIYSEFRPILQKNEMVILRATVDRNEEKGIKLLVREVTPLKEGLFSSTKALEIILPEERVEPGAVRAFRELISRYPGESPVYVRIRYQDHETLIGTNLSVSLCTSLVDELSEIIEDALLRLPQGNGQNGIIIEI
ncbi:MAG: DNA polymerase III subunit alpha [Nitrospirae bacterium]|nr:MAG: DNA polymerase III subunit alpha [Nitrospirota bacterium]